MALLPIRVQAFHWFEASALRGNLKAMHNLAIAYAEGQGTDKNPDHVPRPGSIAPPGRATTIPNSIWPCCTSAATA